MTIKELRKELKDFSEDAEVILATTKLNGYHKIRQVGKMKSIEEGKDIAIPIIVF